VSVRIAPPIPTKIQNPQSKIDASDAKPGMRAKEGYRDVEMPYGDRSNDEGGMVWLG